MATFEITRAEVKCGVFRGHAPHRTMTLPRQANVRGLCVKYVSLAQCGSVELAAGCNLIARFFSDGGKYEKLTRSAGARTNLSFRHDLRS